MTAEVELWAAIDDQRRRTITLLASLSPQDWLQPSLCSEWAVKDVVGHMIWQRDTTRLWDMPPVVAAIVRGRGNIDRATADLGMRWAAARSPEMLLAEMQALPGHHRRVFGTPTINNLIDPIVHYQDIALALGRGFDADVEASVIAADRVWSLPGGFTFPVTVRLSAFRWRATDTAWDEGDGPLVEGPIVAILCALMGRTAAFDHLTGPGVESARVVSAT